MIPDSYREYHFKSYFFNAKALRCKVAKSLNYYKSNLYLCLSDFAALRSKYDIIIGLVLMS